jgi:hypothetical protein
MKTRLELARTIATRTRARFVEIVPRRGVRRGDAMRKLREQDAQRISALLEAARAACAELVSEWRRGHRAAYGIVLFV